MCAHLDKAHNLAWRKFLSAYTILMERIEQNLADEKLPPLSWYDLLFALSEAPGQKLRLHELAQAVFLSRSNVTRLAARLENAGLLYRERCSSDRRGAFAVITQGGLEMLERMWSVYESTILKYFACHLDAAEVKTFIKIMNRMIGNSNSPTTIC